MNFELINGYHDAALKGVDAHTIPGSVILSFVSEGGQKKTLTLHACELFRVTDFVTQNVVSRLLLFHGPRIDTDVVAERLQWASSLSESRSFLSPERLDGILEKIQNDKLSLFVLEPSWGAELVALCGHIST